MQASEPEIDRDIEFTIERLFDARDAASSICPSEVARALEDEAPAWRALMPDVRRVAARLAHEGKLRATRAGRTVDAQSGGGPIRLHRLRPDDGQGSG